MTERSSSTPRVASLLPSATEMVCAVGPAEALVGISHECDWPAEAVRGKPVLTRSRVLQAGASAAVDRSVRDVLRSALAVYDVDVEALARAAPDLIVTQDLCDVCAVSLDDVRRAARALGPPGPQILSLRPTRLADILGDLERVGAALGRAREAAAARAALETRVRAVEQRAARAATRPAVLTIEWIDPPMAGGTWMPELVRLAGGRPLVTEPGDLAPTLAREELAALAPDVVLVKPCGFALERTLAERAALGRLFDGLAWPALAAGRVWLADGHAYFNRPGPRIVDSLEILAACVHPELFADHAGRYAGAFRPFDARA
jgi:iron complex transport system substrate-binding protein